MSESRENTAVNAAILCLADCLCDVRNEAGQCGRNVYDVKSQPFFFLLLFIGKERTNMAAL